MDVRKSDGEVVYRLLKHPDELSSRNWQPRYGAGTATEKGIPELLRTGLSHFLTLENAQAVNEQGSQVARVVLEKGRFYWARTGHIEGHIDVWGRSNEFPPLAEIVE